MRKLLLTLTIYSCVFSLLVGYSLAALPTADAALANQTRDKIEQLILSLAEEEWGEQAMSEAETEEKLDILIRTFCNPLDNLSASIQTEENLNWYLDSVEFHLKKDSSFSSRLELSREDFRVQEGDFAEHATNAFRLIEAGYLTRQEVDRIRALLPRYAKEASDVIIDHFRSAEAVYLRKTSTIDDLHAAVFFSKFAEKLVMFPSFATKMGVVSSDSILPEREADVVEILAALYVEEQIRNAAEFSAELARFKLQSMFNASWYFGEEVPHSVVMNDTIRAEISRRLDTRIGTEIIVVESREVFLYLWDLADLALGVSLGPRIASASSHRFVGNQERSPEQSPESYVRLRFQSPRSGSGVATPASDNPGTD